MKQDLILQIIAKDLGTTDVVKLNALFKSESFQHIKYRMAGKKLGHFGYTVPIKNISKDGLKVFLANKVKLIKFADIEQFEKAKPRVERPVREKKPILAKEKKEKIEKEPAEKKSARKTSRPGSRFIPAKSHG